MPGQDKNARTFSTAEVQFGDATLGGIFQITSKLTAVPGTCMGFFTYADSAVGNDEMDLEMLGASLLKAQTSPYYQPPGIQMTNYRPSYVLFFPQYQNSIADPPEHQGWDALTSRQ